jgi:hypothetical protein
MQPEASQRVELGTEIELDNASARQQLTCSDVRLAPAHVRHAIDHGATRDCTGAAHLARAVIQTPDPAVVRPAAHLMRAVIPTPDPTVVRPIADLVRAVIEVIRGQSRSWRVEPEARGSHYCPIQARALPRSNHQHVRRSARPRSNHQHVCRSVLPRSNHQQVLSRSNHQHVRRSYYCPIQVETRAP